MKFNPLSGQFDMVNAIPVHNALLGLQGGAGNEYYHLSSAEQQGLVDGNETDLHTHDHANLNNIGTNTHAQIDTHLASVLNPHSTTLEQVRSQNNQISGNIDANSFTIVNLTTPSASNDAVNKSYVDNLINGLKWKASVRVATTADITLSGSQTIDGVSVIAGDRVLVKDQSDLTQNGIYVAASGSWTRSTDTDTGTELVSAAVSVEEGTANADKVFVCSTNASITIGVTNITFVTQAATSDHNSLSGLQGGTTGQYYHLTSAEHTEVQSILANGTAANKMLYTTAADTWSEITTTSYGRSLLGAANDIAARILIDAQQADTTLTALAGQNWAVDSLAIGIGADTVGQVTFAANTFPAKASTGSLVAKTITDFGLSLVDDADAATARTTLGLAAGGAGDIWVQLSGDEMTGTLEIDIASDTNLLKFVNNATQTSAVIVQRNSADSGNVSGLNGNGRWMSVGSTSSGYAITSSDFTTTTYAVFGHTSVVGSLTNNTGDFNINGASGQTVFFNSTQIDINHIFRSDNEANLLNLDGGLDAIGIGGTPSSAKRVTISQTWSTTGNPTTLIINGTQDTAAATTLKGATFNVFMTHTTGSLSGANITEFNFTASGNGGTTSTMEGLNFNGSVGTGHTITTGRYIHLYNPTVNGTLSNFEALRIDTLTSTGAYAVRIMGGLVVWNDDGGDYDTRGEGDTLSHMFYMEADAATENIALLATGAPNWQTMDRGLFIGNMTTAPTGNPTSGIFVYVDAGAGKARGTSGTITTWAPAEPHCPVCGSDFMLEWRNDKKFGHLQVCMRCLSNDLGAKPYIMNRLVS